MREGDGRDVLRARLRKVLQGEGTPKEKAARIMQDADDYAADLAARIEKQSGLWRAKRRQTTRGRRKPAGQTDCRKRQ